MNRKPLLATLLLIPLVASCGGGTSSSDEQAQSSTGQVTDGESSSSGSNARTPEQLFQSEIDKGFAKFAAADRFSTSVSLNLSGSVSVVTYAEDEETSTSEAPVYTDEVAMRLGFDIADFTLDGNLIAENLLSEEETLRLGGTATGAIDASLNLGDPAAPMAIKDDAINFSTYAFDNKVYIDASDVLEDQLPLIKMALMMNGISDIPPLESPFYIESDEATFDAIKDGVQTYGMVLFAPWVKNFGTPTYSNQNHTASVSITKDSIVSLLQGLTPEGQEIVNNLSLENVSLTQTFTDPGFQYLISGGVALAETRVSDAMAIAFDLDLDLEIGLAYNAEPLEMPSEDEFANYVLYAQAASSTDAQ